MIKKIKYLFIISMIFLLTGCVKLNMTMDIKSDKSMNLNILYAVDKNIMGDEKLFEDEEIEEYKKSGFEVTDYDQDNYKGVILKKHIKNIDDVSKTSGSASFSLSGITEAQEDDAAMFTVKKSFLKNVYTLKMDNSSTDELTNEIGNDSRIVLEGEDDTSFEDYPTDDDSLLDDSYGDVDYTAALNEMEMTLTVNLPNKPIKHNATSVSKNGKSLTWNLVTQQEDVELTFGLYNLGNIFICILGVVAVVAVVVVISKKGKNKKTPNNQVTNNVGSNTISANTNNNINNNNMINNMVTDNSTVQEQPQLQPQPEVNTNTGEVDDIFPDNKPNTVQDGDNTPLEDMFNNNTNNN